MKLSNNNRTIHEFLALVVAAGWASASVLFAMAIYSGYATGHPEPVWVSILAGMTIFVAGMALAVGVLIIVTLGLNWIFGK